MIPVFATAITLLTTGEEVVAIVTKEVSVFTFDRSRPIVVVVAVEVLVPPPPLSVLVDGFITYEKLAILEKELELHAIALIVSETLTVIGKLVKPEEQSGSVLVASAVTM